MIETELAAKDQVVDPAATGYRTPWVSTARTGRSPR